MQTINLISDTITKPSPAMLDYMHNAEVGDDVFCDDPTVNALQQKVAEMFGKEGALFCPSGTMTNQIAIKLHTSPLEEVICDHNSHIYQYEVGGYAFHSGVAVYPVVGQYGKISVQDIEDAIRPETDWFPKSSLVVLENSTNKGGGNYYTLDELRPIRNYTKEKNLKLHLDGARLFNVLVETGETTLEVGSQFDSISICLSKGLGTPVGSVLTGDRSFIARARKVRKVMGGGMRQAGYLAAAGIYALDHHVNDLARDNANAKAISEVLARLEAVDFLLPVKTNIIIFFLKDPHTAESFLYKLKEKNIIASPFDKMAIRFVFHRDITDGMMEELFDRIKSL
ncbi:MAG: aminotransferase class I/II-fold pyridoxal phosphate-dependent enzyme [Saprospiraceae bacterium]|nr:aminotransferase class I/II-fold pyridoxal phosphate-dependent enzyme [Saprospiraceae bacterium]